MTHKFALILELHHFAVVSVAAERNPFVFRARCNNAVPFCRVSLYNMAKVVTVLVKVDELHNC